jgi:hypothetical protein
MASSINASVSGAGGLISTADNTGILNIQTAGTNAVTVNASQNVGIGTTSPSEKLTVDGNINIPIGRSFYSYLENYGMGTPDSAGLQIFAATGDSVRFGKRSSGTFTENMRIDASGKLLVGQITNPATSSIVVKVETLVANGVNAQITSNTGTSFPWSNYNATGTYVGGITCTSSATSFPTSSDKRLKKNIEDAPSAIDKILTTQVVSHDWIDDNAHVEYGFIAQDLQSIIPQAVIEGTDKEDGSINMPWGVDYSKIVPLLTKAIQEQQTIINDLKARVTALENA